jgi:uncharacterized membrane protein YeiB
VLFGVVSDTSFGENGLPVNPLSSRVILLYCLFYFGVSMFLSHWWLKKYPQGPMEMLLRRLSK